MPPVFPRGEIARRAVNVTVAPCALERFDPDQEMRDRAEQGQGIQSTSYATRVQLLFREAVSGIVPERLSAWCGWDKMDEWDNRQGVRHSFLHECRTSWRFVHAKRGRQKQCPRRL